MNAAVKGTHNTSSSVYRNELNCGQNETCEEEEEIQAPDALLLGSWFIVVLVVLVGFVSNLIVIHAVCCVKRFHRPQNVMLANLSITSVMTVVVYMSVNLLERLPFFYYNSFICGTIATILLLSQPAEGLTMMFISLDRTRTVTRPLERENWGGAYRKVAFTWISSVFVNIPAGYMVVEYDPDKIGSHFKCKYSHSFLGSTVGYAFTQGLFMLTAVLIPSLIVLLDLFSLRKQLKFLITCQVNEAPSGFIASRKRLLRNCLIFSTAFITLRIPVGLLTFLYRLPPEKFISTSVHDAVSSWRKLWVLFHIVHISLNPLLIFGLSTEIRQHLRSLLPASMFNVFS